MEAFNYFLSTLLGVVVGTFITILVDIIKERKIDKEQRKYFKYEIDINVSKIDEWLVGMNDYRNHTNSETLELFSFYFDLDKFIINTAGMLFQTGKIYKILDKEDIKDFQILAQEFSIGWANILNDEIKENRENFDKKKTIQNVIFWENKFKSHKETLKRISSKIK